jgi:hypothetical protein
MTQALSAVDGREEIAYGMSNFGHTVDDGMDEALKAGQYFGQHTARNFYGSVWWDGEMFCEEVWVYGSPRAIMKAATLPELMALVNAEFGSQ